MEKHALEAKEALERKYSVQISDGAFHLAVQGLKTFDSKLIFDDDYSKKSMDVLEGACKLVFDRFKNCAHESELLEKANQLRWALIELSELEKEPDADTQSWVDRLRCERDSASIFLDEFLDTWAVVLGSSHGLSVLTPQCTDNLSFFLDAKNYKSNLDKLVRFLKHIRADFLRAFGPLLIVTCAHVAEAAATIKLTDVPSTLILGNQKKKAIHLTKQRVVDQEHVIGEIYETLASSPRRVSINSTGGLFLLAGPSGSGKTEIAKAVAEHWYGDASRLAEIDVSDYADASEFRKLLTIVVAKRAYSVIVIDKIDKASPSVRKALVDVLSDEAESDDVDLSNSIVIMTHGPIIEAVKLFSDGLLDSVDKFLIVKRFEDYKSVCRVLLREIVRERFGQRRVVHVSNALLTFLVEKHTAVVDEEGGKALKRLLVEEVFSWLPGVLDNNIVVRMDRVAETDEVSIRYQRRGQSVDDWYFKQKDGEFEEAMANFRTKVESVDRILKLRGEHIPLLCWHGHGLPTRSLVGVCSDILKWSPFCRYGDTL